MEESNEKQGGNSGDVFESPNIRNAEGESISVPTNLDGPETSAPAVDGIPIAEENIKFRTKDIKRHDDSKLFVKVEGAEKRAREAERNKKKKDEELIKRLHAAANNRKKEHRKARNEKRVAKLKATHQAIHHKIKDIAKQIYRFRILIIILIVVIIGIIVAKTAVVPAIEEHQAAEQKATEDQIVADNTTPIIKIFKNVVGKKLDSKEVEEIVKSQDPDLVVSYWGLSGLIHHDGETDDTIKFLITKEADKTMLDGFEYHTYMGDEQVEISGTEGNYSYRCGYIIEDSSDLDYLIRKYILKANENNSKEE